jgi:murein DD-endopeptidase MepM/ murein hydrolase activator NlpD
VIAAGAVFGLTGTHALPAMAQTYAEDSAATSSYSAADVQRLRIAADVEASDIRRDAGVQGSADNWSVPLQGELRDAFGPRLQRPVAGVSSFHRGQDLGAACGAPVRAAADGRVVQAGWYGSYGDWVLIDHGGGVQTGYAHNSRGLVRVGQKVQSGQIIAAVGSTGASSGCHVHFETRIAGTAVDPVAFMRTRSAPLK